MNTCSCRARFWNFCIILDSGSNSTVVMDKLRSKIKTKEEDRTTWKIQAEMFTISKKADVDFFLLGFSATKILTWKCHIDDSTNSRYDTILGRHLITLLVLDIEFSENFIIDGEGTYKGCSTPMVDVSNYEFNIITVKRLNWKNPLLTRTSINVSNPRMQ